MKTTFSCYRTNFPLKYRLYLQPGTLLKTRPLEGRELLQIKIW